jgi:hypothetical protein
MAVFLHGKGQLLWDMTEDTNYVRPTNFVASGWRDMHDASNKATDYLFCAFCTYELDRVYGETLANKVWDKLEVANAGNRQVLARLFATYRREYENFTHLHNESKYMMF